MLTPGTIISRHVQMEVLPAVDVVVAGGGTAGVVAALSAARNGANVMLIERYGYLGGMLTAGNAGITMFTKFTGSPELHIADQETLRTNPAELQIAGGITMEIVERLLKAHDGIGNDGVAGSYVFTSSEDFKRILFQMMSEAKVTLRLHSFLADVLKEENRITGVVLESKSGRQIVPAMQFIDCTGDGDLAFRAGAEYAVGVTKEDVCASSAALGEMHPMGVMFKMGNVDLSKTFVWLKKHPEHYKKQPFARFSYEEALERFEKNEMATFDIMLPGFGERIQIYNLPTPGVVTLGCPGVSAPDGCKVEDLSSAEVQMAETLTRWVAAVHGIPGFERAFLLQVPEIGVRETRHIRGDYLLTLEDIYHQKKFDDCIGFGSHPVDTHPRPEWLNNPETAYPSRWYFEIPFGSLTVKRVDNLLTAGRCISATHEASGCIRPTVQCMITGEAAGTAAGLAITHKRELRQLEINILRNQLKQQKVLC